MCNSYMEWSFGWNGWTDAGASLVGRSVVKSFCLIFGLLWKWIAGSALRARLWSAERAQRAVVG